MVSGNPYISANSATRNALNAPKERQSRGVRGLKKVKAKRMKTAEVTAASHHRPELGASLVIVVFGTLLVGVAVSAMAVMKEMHQRASQQQQVRQHPVQVRAMLGPEKETGNGEESGHDQPEGQ